MKKITFDELENLSFSRREAINTLKTNIHFAGVDVKSVLITSVNPGEGKSSISFDLARTIAAGGKRVVLIDADMRKTQMISKLKIKSEEAEISGLTHFLSGQAEADSILCTTNVDNLHMILSGPYSSNPAELINGPGFGYLLTSLREVFDFVIIDSPPLGSVIDAAIIAPMTDGAVVVLEAGKTLTKEARNVAKQLEITGAHILGYVLNKVQKSDAGNYYKYKKYEK